MGKLILLLFFASSFFVIADEVEIQDDLYPFEGASEILYSYEFDDKPKFIQRINDKEFLIVIEDGEDYITYLYDSGKDTTVQKSEFEIDEDETLYEYHLMGDKLYLYFVNHDYGSFFSSSDGLYWRETILDLKSFMPESSRIFYTTFFEDDFEIDDYGEDLDYASKTVDKSIFLKGLEEKEIEPEDYRSYYITYNTKDSAKKNILHIIYEDDEYNLYARVTNYYKLGDNPQTKLVFLKDSVEDLEGLNVYYTYLDDKSNIYYIMSWLDDDTEKRYISFNKITPDGKYTETVKEVPLEIDDDEYFFRTFSEISIKGNEIKLFGISRYEGEGNELEAISGLYIATMNTETMQFELQSKTMTEDEGEELNNDDDELKFNRINGIYEKDGGYVVLAENSKLHTIVTQTQYGTSTTYLYVFRGINLFSLDKDLNFRWNNFLDRELYTSNNIFGNSLSSTSLSPAQVLIIPTLKGDELTYIYSTTEPEEEIVRVKYNISNGEKIDEVVLFENDGEASYSPGYQFPISNNEFVTLVFEDDYYLLKYKLLK